MTGNELIMLASAAIGFVLLISGIWTRFNSSQRQVEDSNRVDYDALVSAFEDKADSFANEAESLEDESDEISFLRSLSIGHDEVIARLVSNAELIIDDHRRKITPNNRKFVAVILPRVVTLLSDPVIVKNKEFVTKVLKNSDLAFSSIAKC